MWISPPPNCIALPMGWRSQRVCRVCVCLGRSEKDFLLMPEETSGVRWEGGVLWFMRGYGNDGVGVLREREKHFIFLSVSIPQQSF